MYTDEICLGPRRVVNVEEYICLNLNCKYSKVIFTLFPLRLREFDSLLTDINRR
jgi:hypothetical protein